MSNYIHYRRRASHQCVYEDELLNTKAVYNFAHNRPNCSETAHYTLYTLQGSWFNEGKGVFGVIYKCIIFSSFQTGRWSLVRTYIN